MYRILVVSLSLFWMSAASVHAAGLPYGEIGDAAKKYLAANVSAKEISKIKKSLFDSVETKMQDGGLTENEALSQIMLDWAFDNQSKIQKKEKAAVARASYYFSVFVDRHIPFPGVIEERLSQEDAHKIIDYLNQEAGSAKK